MGFSLPIIWKDDIVVLYHTTLHRDQVVTRVGERIASKWMPVHIAGDRTWLGIAGPRRMVVSSRFPWPTSSWSWKNVPRVSVFSAVSIMLESVPTGTILRARQQASWAVGLMFAISPAFVLLALATLFLDFTVPIVWDLTDAEAKFQLASVVPSLALFWFLSKIDGDRAYIREELMETLQARRITPEAAESLAADPLATLRADLI